jgi:hypothetical protein
MANERWEQQVRDAAARAEEELKRAVTYVNDNVVPEIRVKGPQALRAAAAQLQRLAERMEQHGRETPPPPPTSGEGKP